MKSIIIVSSVLLLATTALAAALRTKPLTTSQTAVPVQATATPAVQITVSAGKGSEDGKSVFHLTVYPPWAGAEHRVIAFYAGSVGKSGLAALSGSRLTDFGSQANPLTVVGESYTCTARLNSNVTSWTEVRTKTDVRLEVTANPPDQH